MSLKNYYNIISRGSNYTTLATVNWRKRKTALSEVWVSDAPEEKKQKALKLLCEVNVRLERLNFLVNYILRKQQQMAAEAQNQFLILECSNMLCQDGPGGFLMSVKANRYEEGSYHCGNCGYIMRLEGSTELDEMLEEMGISLSRYA